MIVLPIERIFKPTQGDVTADERELDTTLGAAVTSVFADECTWRNAPFVAGTRWSYVPGQPPFNAADLWPPQLLAGLGSAAGFEEADQTKTR